MSRIKKVFSSHSQLCHVWAQQSQPEGRASRMFFENTTDLYSHGFHYLAAKVHTVKGGTFALLRSDAYSVSTAKHLRDAERALCGLMPVFEVKGADAIRDPKEASRYLDSLVGVEIDRALKRKFFADCSYRSESDRQGHLSSIQNALGTASELRLLLGRAEMKMPQKRYDAACAHLDALERKFNSPERKAKREAKANEREVLRVKAAREYEENAKERIEDFRAGREYGWLSLENELLRINGDKVETSGGAEVPLREARALLKIAAKSPFELSGKRIGHFRIGTVEAHDTENGGDFLLLIGCHKILLSEALSVLGKSQLSLVKNA